MVVTANASGSSRPCSRSRSGEPPRGVLDLVARPRERLVAAKRQRHRLAEALEARVGLQAQEHHLALVDLAAGRDVGRGEGQRVRDRLGALDLHRLSPGRGRATRSRLKTPSSAPVPASAPFSDGPVRAGAAPRESGLIASGAAGQAMSARSRGRRRTAIATGSGDERDGEQPEVEAAGPLAADAHRQRPLAGPRVRLEVAEVVDDEDRRREEADRQRSGATGSASISSSCT